MTKKTIETLSVDAVRDSVVVSDYLDQFIPDNDKEPSWDGFVYIYKDKSKTKNKLKGRLPVQIKGTVNNDHSKEEITFPISTIDLNNYLYDGGIVFFVVYLDNTGTKKQIYYVELPPIKIRVFLNAAKDKKKKSIKLKKFPDDPNSKAMIFFNCLENCQKQASFCSAKLLSLEELEKAGVLEGVSIPVSTVGGIDPKTALLKSEIYLYAKIKGSAIPQPIEIIPQDLITTEEKDAQIMIGKHCYYSKVKVMQNADTITSLIGNSFMIRNHRSETKIEMKYQGTDSLRQLTVDLDFMISFIENKYFYYNGLRIPFDENKADLSKFNVNEEKINLEYFKKIVQVLDYLGCKKDINYKTLTSKDWKNIDLLVRAFVDKKPINGLKENLSPIYTLTVGELSFILCFMPVEGKKGTYIIYDFFRMELSLVYENQDGEKLPISQFVLLHADDFHKADNIRYDVLLPSFQKIERHSALVERANIFLLDLIKAYDKDTCKTELLETASDFADWLMEAKEEELPYYIRLLNKLQIEKRKGDLSIDQIKDLFRIVETPNVREDVLVGAYLLLDQQPAAELHFDRLDQTSQEDFKEYPIFYFWKENGGC